MKKALVQHFVDSPHDTVLATDLALAHDQALAPEQVADAFRAGAARWRLAVLRSGGPETAAGDVAPEEVERVRQLNLVKQAVSTGRQDGHDG